MTMPDTTTEATAWRSSQTAGSAPAIAAQGALVCFPVLLPGGDGRVIPFGRYDLETVHHGASSGQVALVDRHTGTRFVLSARQLQAIAGNPDVEIV